jgi:hypothetical protein
MRAGWTAIGLLAAGTLWGVPCRAGDGGFASVDAAASEPFRTAEPSPQGRVFTSRPELIWPVTPNGARRVESVRVTIAGQQAEARWEGKRGIVARPSAPLAPGSYEAAAEVSFDDGWSGNIRWTFQVAAAPPPAPAPSALSRALLEQANALRASANLPAMTLDPRLSWAANRHSEYQHKNNAFGHGQSAGLPGYFGADPQDRVTACGFGDGVYEGVHFGPESARGAMKSLFYAPYHRMAFLQPEPVAFGGGGAGEIFTALCAAAKTSAIVTWPAPGQKNVPRSWSGNEIPNPLRLHGLKAGSTVGTVISFSYFTPESTSIRVESAAIFDESGEVVPFFLNTPKNDDELTDTAFLIPQKPLKPGARYTVSVLAYSVAGGAPLHRQWSFTAEKLPPSAAKPLAVAKR